MRSQRPQLLIEPIVVCPVGRASYYQRDGFVSLNDPAGCLRLY